MSIWMNMPETVVESRTYRTKLAAAPAPAAAKANSPLLSSRRFPFFFSDMCSSSASMDPAVGSADLRVVGCGFRRMIRSWHLL